FHRSSLVTSWRKNATKTPPRDRRLPWSGLARLEQTILRLIVIFQSQMRNQLLTPHPAQSIFQLHELDKNVVLGVNLGSVHRSLEIKRQPFLNAAHPRALRQIHKQNDIEDQRRRQDRIPAQEIDLDLHRIAEPSENID